MKGITRTGAATVAICAALAAALPAAAIAETSCSFRPSSGELDVDSTGTTLVEADGGGRLIVSEREQLISGPAPVFGYVPVGCSDAEDPGSTAEPTVTTTDSIEVRAIGLGIDTLGPGRTTAGEGSGPEIEVTFSGAALAVDGTEGADAAHFGVDTESGGIAANLNALAEPAGDADTDLFAPNLATLNYEAFAADDTVTGMGGGALELPLPASVRTSLAGGDGADVLEAGLGPSRLDAGGGFLGDRLRGGPSDDVLVPGSGDGELIGGAGTDETQFLGRRGVTVDLRVTEPQPTGRGTDLIREIENVTGSAGRDTLIGDDGPNRLNGFVGRDVIDGAAGDDIIDGGPGRNKLFGGRGDDSLEGSSSRDRASGGGGDDRVLGSGGVDSLFGDAGADLLLARDPGGGRKGDKRIDCGPGSGDRARTDKADPEPRSC